MISTFSCLKSLLTEGERRRAQTDPLWRVAIVLEALGPAPRLMEVTGAELLASRHVFFKAVYPSRLSRPRQVHRGNCRSASCAFSAPPPASGAPTLLPARPPRPRRSDRR